MIRESMMLCRMAAAALLSTAAYAGPMTMPGQFEVSPTGAATYTIPIAAPPGTAGIEPKLALSYNSQSGNGLLGVGWSLSGLSTITRCPRTMAQDGVRGGVNYDLNDRYCLDGQRLMAISGTYGADGTEYRTERESFSKIVSYGAAGNGPAWFKVWTKAGQILEYGNTSDSRIEAQGKSTVRVWALNKLSDTKGNNLTVAYLEDTANGYYYPSRISYTGNQAANLSPSGEVQFNYEGRPDVTPMFEGGARLAVAKRLVNIQIVSNAQLVRVYGMAYAVGDISHRARLTQIMLCDATGNCQPTANFKYLDGATSGSEQTSSVNIAGTYYGTNWIGRGQSWGDVNGDGKVDWCRATGDGPGSGNDNIVCTLNAGSGGPEQNVSTKISGGYYGTAWTGRAQAWGDVNGDGKMDWCRSVGDGPGSGNDSIICVINLGAGGPEQIVQTRISGGYYGTDWPSRGQAWVDVNGDGKVDWCRSVGDGPGSNNDVIRCTLNLGIGGAEQIVDTRISGNYYGVGWTNRGQAWVDVNGDGKVDWCRSAGDGPGSGNDSIICVLNLGSGGPEQTVQTMISGSYYGTSWPSRGQAWVDVNGDGKADWCRSLGNGPGSGSDWIRCTLNLGSGVAEQTVDTQIFGNYYGVGWSSRSQAWVDVNGDGKVDWCRSTGDGPGSGNDNIVCSVLIGSGGQEQTVSIKISGSYYGTSWSGRSQIWADVNGDGKAEWCRATGNGPGSGSDNIVCAGIPPGAGFDLMASIVKMDGATAITYKPLSDSTIYTRSAGTTYPTVVLQGAFFAVSSASIPAGNNGRLTTNYTYGGLKAEVGTGRGLLGFAWVQATQVQTGLTTRTEYRQDWPYIGLPSLTKKSVASGGNGGVLSQVTYMYGCLNPQLGGNCTVAAGNRYFPYVSQSTESNWDLNGAALPTVTTANQFDNYGNATQVTVSTSDGYSKTTTNAYNNDTTNWYLGRLQRSQVQSVTP